MNKTWDLSKIYASEEEFNEDYDRAKEDIGSFEDLREDFKGNFKEIARLVVGTSELVDKLFTFSHMLRDEDSTKETGQKLAIQTENLVNDFSQATSFFKPALLSLSSEEFDRLIEENDLDDLKDHFEKIYRYKDHTLSKDEEYILGSLGKMAGAPENAFYMLTNADMTFPKIKSKDNKELTGANYTSFLKDKDVKVREEAFKAMYDTYRKVANTMSTLLYNNANNLVVEAKLRDYNSALEMELFEDRIDTKVYDNLIKAVRKHLPAMYKYYELKKKYLDLDDQHMYDVYLSLGESPYDDIPYERAVEIIKEAIKPLGQEYSKVFAEAIEDRWIDVYPKKGKKSGAYSWGVYSSDPYILLNYTDDLQSMFTLAHEMGHSMHSYFSKKDNDYIYSGYTIFVAEVASTTNELLLLNYLLDHAESDEEKLYLIDHYLDSFKSTVFRQTMFAEFEKIVHEKIEAGEALTLEDLNGIYYQLNKDYFGDAVTIDEDIKMEWMRIPHFYRNFYVYKYATGFSSAVILSKQILEEGNEKYLNFLHDGCRHFPLDQLKAAGADIASLDVLDSSLNVFDGLVEKLEEIIG